MSTVVYSFSFPSNNLLTISVIETNDVKEREKYIVIFTFVPGEGNSIQTRTYNFQRKIVMKFSLRELPGLAMTLQRAAEGFDNIVLPYTKFTKSISTKKLDIFMGQLSQQQETKAVVMNISSGDNKFALKFSKADAYSVGAVIMSIYNHFINKDIIQFQPKPFDSKLFESKKEDESIPSKPFAAAIANQNNNNTPFIMPF